MSQSALPANPAPDHLLSAADDLRAVALAKAEQLCGALTSADARSATEKLLNDTTRRWREVSDNAAGFIKENPGKAALAALGIGFAIGLLFRQD